MWKIRTKTNPEGHYTKYNNSEKTKYCHVSLKCESKKPKTQEQSLEWWLPGLRGGEVGQMLVRGHKLPVKR